MCILERDADWLVGGAAGFVGGQGAEDGIEDASWQLNESAGAEEEGKGEEGQILHQA